MSPSFMNFFTSGLFNSFSNSSFVSTIVTDGKANFSFPNNFCRSVILVDNLAPLNAFVLVTAPLEATV